MNPEQRLLPNDAHHGGEDETSNDTQYDARSDLSRKSLRDQKRFRETNGEENDSSNSKIGVENFNIMEKLVKLYQEKKRQVLRSRWERFQQNSKETSERNERLKINCHSLDCHSDDAYFAPWSYKHQIKQGRNNVNFHSAACYSKKSDIRQLGSYQKGAAQTVTNN